MSDTNTAINTVSVDCPAKTNLTLHVGRPRSEWGGRHELDTIYCAVGVYDTVTTSRKKPGSGFSLNLEGAYLGDLASSGSDMRRNHAVLALFAKALPGSIRAFLMTLATVDDLLAISSDRGVLLFGERMVLVRRHRRMRCRMVFSGAYAQSAMACRGHCRHSGLGDDVRSWCASYFGWRACWIAHAGS